MDIYLQVMRNSLGNRTICLKLLIEYCQMLRVKPRPKLIFTRKDILTLPRADKLRANNTKKMDGCYYSYSDTIYINIRNHQNRKQLENTLVHELVHKITKLTLKHGKQFENFVTLISSQDIK